VLLETRKEALNIPRGDIILAFCQNCGLIFNNIFDNQLLDYNPKYENSLRCSPVFQDYDNTLADYLIEKYDLNDKHIIEIGCGKGDFLLHLCKLGKNQGIGFDPAYDEQNREENSNNGIQFIKDYYSEKYSQYKSDFICCRHTLEHISDPRLLLKTIRKSLTKDRNTNLFFEVPNMSYTIKNNAIWDIIYEHCLYFTTISLSNLFLLCGFEIRKIEETYGNQFLCLEASAIFNEEKLPPLFLQNTSEFLSDLRDFQRQYLQKIQIWENEIEEITQKGQKIVVWGAGSKGVTFLNLLSNGQKIEYVVDINPLKQGKFISGTGQKIVAPEFLNEYNPQIILVMNPIYGKTIQQLVERLGLKVDFKFV
jgi:SAM-dependent methyltransferase